MNEVRELREELEKRKLELCELFASGSSNCGQINRYGDAIIYYENKLIALGWLKPEEMTV